MLRVYVRLALLVLGLCAAVVLFAFAFTAAAIVVLIGFVVLALIGRSPRIQWMIVRQPRHDATRPFERRSGLTIDHDPNDLPPQ